MAIRLSVDETLVQEWLSQRGYSKLEYEPQVGAKKRPDFLAIAEGPNIIPGMLWAEVKSLQSENTSAALDRTWPILKQLDVPAGLSGRAMLHVAGVTRNQSVRAVVKMFHQNAPKHSSVRARLIFIQQLPDKRDVRFVGVQGTPIQKVWARGTEGKKIAAPTGTIEDSQAIAQWEINGDCQSAPAFQVFDWLTGFDCALVVEIDPEDRPLTSISSMSSGGSTASARALYAIERANSQLRQACSFRPAAGVVFIVPAEEHADDLAIATAIYGKLTVPVSLATSRTQQQFGEAFYGYDGAFRPNKNTHISAVIRLRQNGESGTYFPNPFAKHVIGEDASLFSGLRRARVTFA